MTNLETLVKNNWAFELKDVQIKKEEKVNKYNIVIMGADAESALQNWELFFRYQYNISDEIRIKHIGDTHIKKIRLINKTDFYVNNKEISDEEIENIINNKFSFLIKQNLFC